MPQHEYCLVMEDNFDGPSVNTSIWDFEVQVGGFGSVGLSYDIDIGLT